MSKAMAERLFVAQLKAAGVEYIFFNPSTGDHPIFDALVDEPSIKSQVWDGSLFNVAMRIRPDKDDNGFGFGGIDSYA
jgi:hypothetical protein